MIIFKEIVIERRDLMMYIFINIFWKVMMIILMLEYKL